MSKRIKAGWNESKKTEVKHSNLHKLINGKCDRYVKNLERIIKLVAGAAVMAYAARELNEKIDKQQWQKAGNKAKSLVASVKDKVNNKVNKD